MSVINNLQQTIRQDSTKFSNYLYTKNQQGLLKVLGYFLAYSIVKDIILKKKPCYKKCADKCEMEAGR